MRQEVFTGESYTNLKFSLLWEWIGPNLMCVDREGGLCLRVTLAPEETAVFALWRAHTSVWSEKPVWMCVAALCTSHLICRPWGEGERADPSHLTPPPALNCWQRRDEPLRPSASKQPPCGATGKLWTVEPAMFGQVGDGDDPTPRLQRSRQHRCCGCFASSCWTPAVWSTSRLPDCLMWVTWCVLYKNPPFPIAWLPDCVFAKCSGQSSRL